MFWLRIQECCMNWKRHWHLNQVSFNNPNWLLTHFLTRSAWQPGCIWRISSHWTATARYKATAQDRAAWRCVCVCICVCARACVCFLRRCFTTGRTPLRCLCGAHVSRKGVAETGVRLRNLININNHAFIIRQLLSDHMPMSERMPVSQPSRLTA